MLSAGFTLLLILGLFRFVAETHLWMVLCFEGGVQGDNQSRDSSYSGGWSFKCRGRRAASCFLISQETKRHRKHIAQENVGLPYLPGQRWLPEARAASNFGLASDLLFPF